MFLGSKGIGKTNLTMKYLSILGSTGSIGQSTLDVVRRHKDKFCIVGLAEGHDVELLAKQIEEFSPRIVSVRDAVSVAKLRELIHKKDIEILHGLEGAAKVACVHEAQTVVSAIVGAAGLNPTMAAIKAGKTIALANKETMVVAGELVCKEAIRSGSKILPVDSEHSALFQSLEGHKRHDVKRLILTASGGPFLKTPASEFSKITPEMALKHPRWSMGAKITIDSATLMNKGLEVIEAHWLFSMEPKKISVIVHPQSIVHSMVEYNDGCVMAELGVPDMRAPIAYAISYPDRIESGVERLDLAKLGTLTFEEPDLGKFSALGLAYQALEAGGSMPCVLNAANEIAVTAFIDRRIKFTDIVSTVEKTMNAHRGVRLDSIPQVLEIDAWARQFAKGLIQ